MAIESLGSEPMLRSVPGSPRMAETGRRLRSSAARTRLELEIRMRRAERDSQLPMIGAA
ncbi:MAG: hypothetical protein JWQ77_1834 [Jatrophihabitans sp.]|nr:hypothetical protein [Jatrophihabitans sp.]